MFIEKLLKCALLLSAVLLLPTHAFWWAPSRSTTTTESPLALKHIPLTYFRTYTYQPLPGTSFANFPFYHHPPSALHSPLLAGATRFEHTGFMPGGGYPISVPALQQQQHLSSGPAMPQLYQPVLHSKPSSRPTVTTSTTTARPTTTSTSTSTTTTTTTTTTPSPPPSTTTSTTTSTTASAPALPVVSDVQSLSSYSNAAAYPYPTYNRRTYVGYNPPYYRATYPYPDYTVYKTAPLTRRFGSHGGQVQFVPCMCPVSAAAASAESDGAVSIQGRTADGEESDMNVPDGQKVVTEASNGEKESSADPKKIINTAVDEKIGSESEITRKLTEKAMGADDEQLSTNKIEEEIKRATREVESDKQKIL